MRAYLSILLLCLLALPLTLVTTAFAQTPQQPDEATVLAQADAQLQQGQYDLAVKSYSRAIELAPNDAKAYRGRGAAYGNQGKFDLALADCEVAIKLAPNFSDGFQTRGWVYGEQAQYDKAIADETTAIQLNPDNAKAYLNRGYAYGELGKHDKEIADDTTAIQLDPNSAIAYLNRGGTYIDLGKYDLAIADCNEAIKLDPNYADAYINRGCAYGKQSKYDKEIADDTVAIQLNPNSAIAYSDRGFAYESLGKYDLAIADCNEAIKLDPNDADAYANRGIAYHKLGKNSEAISDFNIAIKLDPNDSYDFDYRGWTYESLGKHDLAIADFAVAIKLDPNDAYAYHRRGGVYEELGNDELAIADFDVAIKLAPNDADTYLKRGSAYGHQSKYDREIADESAAIQLDPDSVAAYSNRGYAYEELGKYELAIADFDLAIKHAPNNAGGYVIRGWAYGNLGKYDKEIADETAAIQLNPNDAEAYYCRGTAYRALGDTTSSEADIAKSTALNTYGKDAPSVEQAFFTDNKKSCSVNFERTGPMIFVKARIGNEKKKYLFALDTGADITYISEQLASELKLHKLGELPEFPDAFGTKLKSWPCLLDSITLGTCRVLNPTCVIADLQASLFNQELKNPDIMLGGIIGVDFLRHYRVTIDYVERKITFSQTTDPLSGTYILKAVDQLEPMMTQLTIPITVDGQMIDVIPDTGASKTFLPLSVLQKLDYPKEEKLSSNGLTFVGMAGESSINDMLVRVHDLRIGDNHLQNYLVGAMANTGVLGVDFLSQFLVTLDYPSNTLALTPVAQQKFNHNLFSTGIAGINIEQHSLRISGIWENSPAAKAGLHPGDLILEINGKQATQSAYAAFDDDNITSLLLLVESNGAQRSVTVKKAYLFPPLPSDEQKK